MCQQLNGDHRIDVSEQEPGMSGQRLHLLSVIRGLESLEQSSKVSLITGSRYVGRGIRHSLQVWKENDWQWEHFGIMRPIKHKFLWQRIERAMQHHEVECRVWCFNSAKNPQPEMETRNRSAIRPQPVRTSAFQPAMLKLEPQAATEPSEPVEKPTPQEQVTTWANELASRLETMGLSPIAQYPIH